MIYANAPSQFVLAWGANAGVGYIRTVPVTSQIGIQNGAASFADGYVPLNMTPVNAGGVPPFGQDQNGVLNVITSWLQYIQAGYVPQFNSSFSGTIGGYPKGALIGSLAGNGALWVSSADSNTNNPDTTSTNWIMVPNSLIGSMRNLTGTAGGGNKLATWKFDQLCVGTGLGGGGFLLQNGNMSFNGGGTGLGGMDTGVMPNGSNLYIYAMFNPVTGASGVIGTVAGSGATIYPGANAPAGFIASALVWSGVTVSTNFIKFNQFDRVVATVGVAILSSATGVVAFTSQSLSGGVPPNAKFATGTLIAHAPAAIGQPEVAADSTGGMEVVQGSGTTASIANFTPTCSFRRLMLATSQTLWWNVTSNANSWDLSTTGYEF